MDIEECEDTKHASIDAFGPREHLALGFSLNCDCCPFTALESICNTIRLNRCKFVKVES